MPCSTAVALSQPNQHRRLLLLQRVSLFLILTGGRSKVKHRKAIIKHNGNNKARGAV
jgi:hypothetical protein